ncbi:hypothetical protein GLV98_07135 [Halobacillus litoralis]|uniref:Uncharacterized protein n=1 Tax=Halobacillus litoralis TaxID=45668 RepID=A0A845E343_9BACI|nr:hypothetical protein [Halobacillus litoralis]
MMKLLLTGFEPFLHYNINSTQRIVRALDNETICERTDPLDLIDDKKRGI